MSKQINRREILKKSLATTAAIGTGVACAVAVNGRPDALVLRFRSHAVGGTYGYKFACCVRRWAGVEEADLVRDWRFNDFTFIVISQRPIDLIMSDMTRESISARVEILET